MSILPLKSAPSSMESRTHVRSPTSSAALRIPIRSLTAMFAMTLPSIMAELETMVPST